MSTWAIILAAGSGNRMGGIAKQFIVWRQRPLYWHSAIAFARSAAVEGLVFVFPAPLLAAEEARIRELALRDSLGLPWRVAAGGKRRQDSCANGLAQTPMPAERVLVHDAARPFVSAELVRRVCAAVSADYPCVVPAIAVADTIKLLRDGGDFVEKTLPRQQLAACQTPQGFWAPALRAALEANDMPVTDDAGMLEAMGHSTKIVAGDPENVKLTLAADLRLLEEARPLPRPCNGFGYDAHRYGSGRSLKLGGVWIGGDYEVLAHSDGDVLLHALMDALLGMAALGDIGKHFPDSDPELEGISSAILLDSVLQMLQERGIEICHVDLTVIAQKPKLAPHAEAIRANVARLLALAPECVNFKATTEEGMGFTGKCEGIKACALASGLRRAWR